ncbi:MULTISPECIES: ATP-binding protein [Aneurinibacillus]|jgi:two-component system sensor histidine kinase DctS|uniref:histidine kinase n=1 Tax=Aneurinibacillus danicus TaxID=267746 RepID=A0A511V5T1_9BACL|nr:MULTISPECIES: sensor histidine kinase [Aneurinibacillus]GEN33278.1 putative C4-dicarboxylate sensor kinase [Aneurinibacillus danicus]
MLHLDNWPIRRKITLLVFGIVLFTLLMDATILIGKIASVKVEDVTQRSLLTAKVTAQMPEVKRAVEMALGAAQIQPLIEQVRTIYGADYIVVVDMDGKRMSHPIESRIGTYFNVNEAKPAFAEHVYVDRVKGDLGEGVRAYAPIMNEEHQQVGVVMVGNTVPQLLSILEDMSKEMALIFSLTLCFGILGAYLLASHIKQQTFQLEPQELARTLDERTSAFHAIHEGIIAIDEHERITVINEAARRMLKVKGDAVGENIRKVIPDTRLPEILELGYPIYNQQFYIGDTLILSNRVPIKVKGKTAGALAIFQDKTEVTRLAEELTGVKAFVDALRAKNHEHSNKLHTIAGLIQLGKEQEALRYIFQLDEEEENVAHYISARIQDINLTGLLIGKISRAKELGIALHIDPYSEFNMFPEGVTYHDLVIIIGNLIENAFEGMAEVSERDKRVDVSIVQDESYLTIEVEDNGIGIPQEIQQQIFAKGFSTKQKGERGIGLYLVSSIVERSGGEIEVDSAVGCGTWIRVKLPMERKEDTQYEQND